MRGRIARHQEEDVMERLAIVFRLKRGTADRVRELVSSRRSFNLRASGIERHTVLGSPGEVVFVSNADHAAAPRSKTWA